jgi:dihydrofolate reductase
MSKVTAQISMSLDGYVAGPEQTRQDPLGQGGERLHDWRFAAPVDPVDAELASALLTPNGAYIMGRGMFGPVPGEWTGEWPADWRGWWGEDPPFHRPVFVLTHHEREPVAMAGGTTYHFVTEGFAVALERARAAAGDEDVAIAGGAATIDQALAAGALDELLIHHVPMLLGGGERLFANAGTPALEIAETIVSPAATHVRYRVVR